MPFAMQYLYMRTLPFTCFMMVQCSGAVKKQRDQSSSNRSLHDTEGLEYAALGEFQTSGKPWQVQDFSPFKDC